MIEKMIEDSNNHQPEDLEQMLLDEDNAEIDVPELDEMFHLIYDASDTEMDDEDNSSTQEFMNGIELEERETVSDDKRFPDIAVQALLRLGDESDPGTQTHVHEFVEYTIQEYESDARFGDRPQIDETTNDARNNNYFLCDGDASANGAGGFLVVDKDLEKCWNNFDKTNSTFKCKNCTFVYGDLGTIREICFLKCGHSYCKRCLVLPIIRRLSCRLNDVACSVCYDCFEEINEVIIPKQFEIPAELAQMRDTMFMKDSKLSRNNYLDYSPINDTEHLEKFHEAELHALFEAYLYHQGNPFDHKYKLLINELFMNIRLEVSNEEENALKLEILQGSFLGAFGRKYSLFCTKTDSRQWLCRKNMEHHISENTGRFSKEYSVAYHNVTKPSIYGLPEFFEINRAQAYQDYCGYTEMFKVDITKTPVSDLIAREVSIYLDGKEAKRLSDAAIYHAFKVGEIQGIDGMTNAEVAKIRSSYMKIHFDRLGSSTAIVARPEKRQCHNTTDQFDGGQELSKRFNDGQGFSNLFNEGQGSSKSG